MRSGVGKSKGRVAPLPKGQDELANERIRHYQVPIMSGLVKSLWSSIQGDPVFMQRVNGWLTIFWIAMIPISIATGWINSITYVASLSLWALVSGHWSAWQAARVEVAQKREEERRAAEDMAGEIIERVVEETDVEKQR
jgi:hypothetical protein